MPVDHLKTTKRKLLTVFAADVAGFSQAVSHDEQESLKQLSSLRAMLDFEVEKNGGKIANTAGDSVLAIFESPVNAIQAAVSTQTKHDQYSKTLSTNVRLRFRIGLNIGDVAVYPSGDVLGHGVNVAARLEALAEPGGICLSENVREQAFGKLDLEFTKLGEHYLKNIDGPVKVFSVGQNTGLARRRILFSAEKFGRSPAFVFSVLVFMFLTIATFIFLPQNQSGSSDKATASLNAFLLTNPTSKELLSFFDLVTHGKFNGTDYYVIRTWGGDIEDLQRVAEILGGHVVAIGSADENQFVFELTLRDAGHWIEREGQQEGPMIGLYQEEGAVEPDQGWKWMNGEPLVYTNWKRYGPENFGGNQSLAHFKTNHGTAPSSDWNDIGPVLQSFIVEVPTK